MDFFIIHILFLFIQLKSIFATFLNENEIKISFDVIEKLRIRQCILVGDVQNGDLIFHAKQLSTAKIPITYMNFKKSINFVEGTENPYFSIGLIFKDEDFRKISEIFYTVMSWIILEIL